MLLEYRKMCIYLFWPSVRKIDLFFIHPSTIYTIYRKVCEHPFKLVDSAISDIFVADRCIKLSTPPCNLHRQTLAHCRRMPPFQIPDLQELL